MIAETRSRLLGSSAQSGTALGATGANNGATTWSSHASTKAVGAFSLQYAGLKCTFHFIFTWGNYAEKGPKHTGCWALLSTK